MQNLSSINLSDFRVKIKANKLAFYPLYQEIKNHLNHLLINISNSLNIDEMCNALLKTSDVTVSHFCDVQFIQTKNQHRQQIYVQLSAKLTKAFGRCFQALLNFFSQEIFCESKIRIEFR